MHLLKGALECVIFASGAPIFFRNVSSILLEDGNWHLVLSNLCFLECQNVDLVTVFYWFIGSPTDCMSGKLERIKESRWCPLCPKLGDGHFGHVRFKSFVIFDFDGHLVVV